MPRHPTARPSNESPRDGRPVPDVSEDRPMTTRRQLLVRLAAVATAAALPLSALPLSATALLGWARPAHAGALAFGYVPNPGAGKPAFLLTPSKAVASLNVRITCGGRTLDFSKTGLPAGEQVRFEFTAPGGATEATAHVIADFTDSSTEEVRVPFSWSAGQPLEIDLSNASADVTARTITVEVTAAVERAEIVAYGARKAVLAEKSVPIGAGPGRIDIPWVGDPADVVLLDIKLHTPTAWASFTYSPWFLDIPHDDVRFPSGSADIPADEEPKLHATLKELQDVLDKYGDVVPVKLFIAGCTDTVGSKASNLDLSRRRARSIARWLRDHGYGRYIAYHGFGEELLAVGTGDEVDHAANRRALYLVGANPPPAGSGIPSVRWTEL